MKCSELEKNPRVVRGDHDCPLPVNVEPADGQKMEK
jgi:hypothetical protein